MPAPEPGPDNDLVVATPAVPKKRRKKPDVNAAVKRVQAQARLRLLRHIRANGDYVWSKIEQILESDSHEKNGFRDHVALIELIVGKLLPDQRELIEENDAGTKMLPIQININAPVQRGAVSVEQRQPRRIPAVIEVPAVKADEQA